MLFQVVNDLAAGIRSCLAGIVDPGRSRIMCDRITTDHVDQQFLKIKCQKLLGTEGNLRFLDHLLQIRVVQRCVKTVPRLCDDASEDAPFCF